MTWSAFVGHVANDAWSNLPHLRYLGDYYASEGLSQLRGRTARNCYKSCAFLSAD